MKKFLIGMVLSALTMCFFSASAQSGYLDCKGSNGRTLDTLRNGVTKYLTSPKLDKVGKAGKYDFAITITNDSATTAATVILESSMDSISWTPHFKLPAHVGALTNGINCDSLAVNGTTYHIYSIRPGATRRDGANNELNSASGRRLWIRAKIVHQVGGRSSYSGRITTSE